MYGLLLEHCCHGYLRAIRIHTCASVFSLTGPPTLLVSNMLPPPSPFSPSSSSFLSPSPAPTDTTTPHGSGADVGVIVGALMGVLLVLAILITVILLILLLLWRKQYRTKQPPIDNPTYQGEHSSFSLNYRGSPVATKVTGRLGQVENSCTIFIYVNKKTAQEYLLLIN